MHKFKKMKFIIGDDKKLAKIIHDRLVSLGYDAIDDDEVNKAKGLYTCDNGRIAYSNNEKFKKFIKCYISSHELINIDWMRKEEEQTIESLSKRIKELEEKLSKKGCI